MTRALVIEHEADADLGWFRDWFADAGLAVDVARPYRGDEVPSAVEHDALVVLGGVMGAYDDADYPWLTRTKLLQRRYVDAAVPCLGICLGHQLLAVAAGGVVRQHPADRQRGALPVGLRPAATGDSLLGGLSAPTYAVQWNGDVVTELPPAAVPLAAGEDGYPQAFRVGSTAWGVQFHPEAGAERAALWAGLEAGDAGLGDVAEKALASVRELDDVLAGTWSGFARRFAEVVATRAPAHPST